MKKNIIILILMILTTSLFATVTQSEVSKLYVSIFNRASEGSGNRYWQDRGNKISTAQIANEMLNTLDAKEYFGDTINDNQKFIEHIYKNTLNKTIDDDRAGIEYWVNELKSKTKGDIVVSLISAIDTYSPTGVNYNPKDIKTVDSYNQFKNRVDVSNYMAENLENPPANYKTSTNFAKDLIVTKDLDSVDRAKNKIREFAQIEMDTIQNRILYSTSEDELDNNQSIYIMDSDGKNSKRIFNFSTNSLYGSGRIFDLSFYKNNIYFISDAGWLHGPAYNNIFEVPLGTNNINQITPGENSGKVGLKGRGVVTGTVISDGGSPYANTFVYLEGREQPIKTDASGGFRFDNVAEGDYWLVGYRPFNYAGNSDVFDSKFIHVINDTTSGPWTLIPNSSNRWSFKLPKKYNERIYYIFNMAGLSTAIKYTDRKGTIPNIDVLKYDGDKECGGEFDAFDVGKKSGKLIMLKYKTGSRCLGGVYTSDKDGNDYTQIIDMGKWSSLSLIYEGTFSKIFWNRDETLFTMNASFQDDSSIYQGLLVFDSNGELKSQIYSQPNQSIIIYGWSSDSKFILFSLSPSDNMKQQTLMKIKVNDGILDSKNITTLIENKNISGATWTY